MSPKWKLLAVAVTATIAVSGGTLAYADSRASWEEQFDGEAGSPPDAARWEQQTGCEWGNGKEEQCYTDGGRNAELDGEGNLVITAKAEEFNDRHFTSARLRATTINDPGTVEVRAKFSGFVAGAWPAIWTTDEANWPSNGELDLMEIGGGGDWKPQYHSHFGTVDDHQQYGDFYPDDSDDPTWTDWHTYRVDYTNGADGKASFYIDDKLAATVPYQVPDDAPAYVILNIAVGGWAGTPDPQLHNTMSVDYVKVTEA